VVLRPRLLERLNAGLHRKLPLIAAPAGFGKTTLVSEWVAACQRPVAWLSLDEGENDPVLDDYHVIDAKPVDLALAFLVEHLPPQMHLVIAICVTGSITWPDGQVMLPIMRGQVMLPIHAWQHIHTKVAGAATRLKAITEILRQRRMARLCFHTHVRPSYASILACTPASVMAPHPSLVEIVSLHPQNQPCLARLCFHFWPGYG